MKTLSALSPILCLLAAVLTTSTMAQSVVPAPLVNPSGPTASSDQVPQGLEASEWSSIRAAHESWQHSVQPLEDTPGRWQARNPGQQWATEFDGRGFTTRAKGADWEWGLELKSYGFPGSAVLARGQAQATADGQRMVYQWDRNVQEWWINDQRGLEHGFTIAERPAGASASAHLELDLGVRGTLRASVAADAQTVYFRDSLGAPVVTYTGLKVWDAEGKELAASFRRGSAGGLILEVEERGARYPLTIDPIAQQAYLKAPTWNASTAGDQFGTSVAVSGETVVVGAPYEDREAGAAYIFVRSGTTWSQQAHLKASNVSPGDRFGYSVAVSGDTVIVGSPYESSSTRGVNSTPNDFAGWAGAAYVYVRSGTTWAQQAYLKASQASAVDLFGTAVAVSGDTVVIGAPWEDSNTTGVNSTPNNEAVESGAVYIFVRNGTIWTEQAYLKASQVSAGDEFGTSVALSVDTVVVGAYQEDSSTSGVNSTPDESAGGAGAAYVFVRNGNTWTQQAYLKADRVSAGDEFGTSVAVSGNTVVVGAPYEDSRTTGVNNTPTGFIAQDSGAAYVFVRNGTTWTQEAYVKASQVSDFDHFGESVAVEADTLVVGSIYEDSSTTGVDSTPDELLGGGAGAAYVFGRSGTTWTQQAYIKASQVSSGDRFGASVAVSGNTVLVGCPLEDSSSSGLNSTPDEAATDAGAAYAFVRGGTTWSQQCYVKMASNGPESNDHFGVSVAVSGDTVIVGVPLEDSGSTGVNSTSNNDAKDSGAAYVFVRSGASWMQQAYLKASLVAPGDRFGTSVAVNGDTAVVGASGQGDDDSGAAYVFVRNGVSWTQQGFLKASVVSDWAYFGHSVAVSGDAVVVGAPGENSSSTGVNSTPDGSVYYAGAAYIFVRNGASWIQEAYLKSSQVSEYDSFGDSVAVSGDVVVVGAPHEASSTTGVNSTPDEDAYYAGAAYIFVRNGASWIQEAYLKASQVSVEDRFGASVAASGGTVVVGSPGEDSSTTEVNSTPDEEAPDSGAAYVFVRSGTSWTQQAYLKSSHLSYGKWFGNSMAASEDTVVIGALYEDSSTTGINSTPVENASNAGAAYVFVRGGTTWIQQAYLKASQVSASDEFGTSVAVSGDTVIVGAPYEDSSTTGVDSTANDSALDTGAAYIFTGFGPMPQITLSGLGTAIASGDLTPSAEDGTDFGRVAVLNSQTVRRFTIGNSGLAPLMLSGASRVDISGGDVGDFNVTTPPKSAVPMGGDSTFDIAFNPRLPGRRSATVTISSNDPDTPSFSFAISGFGVLPTLLSQSISFNPPATVYLSQNPLPLSATASSGLPVTFSLLSGPADLLENVLTLTSPGTVKIMATQPGGDNYQPAKSVTRTIVVLDEPAELALTSLTQTYDGLPKEVTVVGAVPNLIVYEIDGVESVTPPTNAGSYPVRAVAGSLTKTGTLVVAKAPLTVTPNDVSKFVGQPNPALTVTIAGFVGTDSEAVLTKAPVLATKARTASRAGAYPITASGAAAANYSFIYRQGTLVIESLGGNYEALLADGNTLPVGKMAVKVSETSKGSVFTATLDTPEDTRPLSFKGALTIDSDNERATGIAASTTPAGMVYVINFTLPLLGDLTANVSRNLVPLGSVADGKKLPVLKNVAYAGAHTAILRPATSAGTGVPAGAGWATAQIAKDGTLKFRGRLADATGFTASLFPDDAVDPGYRLFAQPYLPARAGTYLAGEFALQPHPDLAGRRYLESAPLTWVKDERTRDRSYRAGFGPVTTALGIDPWLRPIPPIWSTSPVTLAQRLGLTGLANPFEVQHTPTGSTSNADLPTALSLGARNVVTVTAPVTVPPNRTKWRTTLVATNGTFTGSFELLDNGKRRPVAFSGVLRQAPSTSVDDVIGNGHYLLPALPGAPSNESATGEVLFLKPASPGSN